MTDDVGHLDRFFATIRPFLDGDTDAAELRRALGPSQSPDSRLDWYPRLVQGDLARIIEDTFPAVKRALDHERPGEWPKLLARYRKKHLPTHWEVARYGEHLPAFLRDEHTADPSLPSYLEELADFQWSMYCAATARPPADGESNMERTVFVRQYTHRVPQFARAGEACGPCPEPGATMVIIYQHRTTLLPSFLLPSVKTLLALGRRAGTNVEAAAVRANVSNEDLAAGDAELERAGMP